MYRWRAVSTVISGLIAGLAGALFGNYVGVLAPSILGFQEMTTIIMMVIVGGYCTWTSPLMSAVLLQYLMESFRIIREWRLVVFTIVVILLVRFIESVLSEY